MLPNTVVHPPIEFKKGVYVISDDVELKIYKESNPYPDLKVTILEGGAYQAAQIWADEIEKSKEEGLVVMGTAGNSMLPGGNVSLEIKGGVFDSAKTYKTHEENIYAVALETLE